MENIIIVSDSFSASNAILKQLIELKREELIDEKGTVIETDNNRYFLSTSKSIGNSRGIDLDEAIIIRGLIDDNDIEEILNILTPCLINSKLKHPIKYF